MKVGILTQWYDPEPGPAGLPAALARGLVNRGHQVSVLTGFPNYPTGQLADGYSLKPRSSELLDGVRVTRVALYPSHEDSLVKRAMNYGSFALSAALLGVHKTFKDIDVLWVNYSPVTVALPMFAQHALRRTPSVVHVLDLWPDTLTATGFLDNRRFTSRAVRASLNAVCNSMYRTASRVAYISPGVGSVLQSRGVNPEKLAYAPMWANESVFHSTSQTTPTGPITLLYAGTLGRAQGLEAFVRAAGRLQHLPLRFLIAGSGTDEHRLKAVAAEVGASNVQFLGRVPQGDMPTLMAQADAHFVSLNDDPLARITMPSKIQSILATGGPILGALVGDAAEVVQGSGAGWVCTPGDEDQLLGILQQVVREGRDGIRSRRDSAKAYYQREFAFDRGIEKIEDLLLQAVSEKR